MRVRGVNPGSDDRGAAALEFALVVPFLLVLLTGIVLYGGWFWLAHSVQSLASEGARAAVAGLDRAEQQALARDRILDDLSGAGLRPDRADIGVTVDNRAIRVRLTYDASDHPLMALSGLAPTPPQIIERTAVVRVGGY
jgi:hypothetical protein